MLTNRAMLICSPSCMLMIQAQQFLQNISTKRHGKRTLWLRLVGVAIHRHRQLASFSVSARSHLEKLKTYEHNLVMGHIP
jgi:hypothetical protein